MHLERYFMAQAVSETAQLHRSVKYLILDWQSASDGSVDYTTSVDIDGQISMVFFSPDSGGTRPTDLYDVQINDVLTGADLLLGTGANLYNATAVLRIPILTNGTQYYGSPVFAGKLNLVISNAGDTKGGVIVLYWR